MLHLQKLTVWGPALLHCSPTSSGRDEGSPTCFLAVPPQGEPGPSLSLTQGDSRTHSRVLGVWERGEACGWFRLEDTWCLSWSRVH